MTFKRQGQAVGFFGVDVETHSGRAALARPASARTTGDQFLHHAGFACATS